jgi:hypothetical protein
VLNVELAELRGELAEEFGIFDVLAQLGCLAGGHTPADVTTVLPALVLEVWAAAHDPPAAGVGMFAVFLGKGSGLHGGDGGDLFHKGLPDLIGGWGYWFHREQFCLGSRHRQAKKNSQISGIFNIFVLHPAAGEMFLFV